MTEQLPIRWAHSHRWIDPAEPAISRATYSSVVGPGRREMKPGRTYVCMECGERCELPAPAATFAHAVVASVAPTLYEPRTGEDRPALTSPAPTSADANLRRG